MDDEQQIDKLKKIINDSDNIVFFGGAGVSTESGIPDFRSVDGLYNQQYDYPPETILSHDFFYNNTDEFYRFYRNKMLYSDVKPNIAHIALAKLEQKGKLKAIVTQNIDNLHTLAGSKNVLELHGNVYRNYCTKCHKSYDVNYISQNKPVPKCTCGALIKPDVVLYQESLNSDILEKSVRFIKEADVLIVGGTSLNVYPAAGLINYYRGNKLILINKSSTPYDNRADLIINKPIGQVFASLDI